MHTLEPQPITNRAYRVLTAVVIGNALEWYDFIIYGLLAAMMAKHFFPPADPTVALLSSYAAFATTCIVRPFGGVLIGIYSDRSGRVAALMLIIACMSIAMLIMTVTPAYASIGLGSTVLMIVARLLQALSAGGEFGSAASFLIESVPARRRGLLSGLYSSGTHLATIMAALLGLLITQGMSVHAQDTWGWRIPFAVGLLIAPVGYYIRSRLQHDTASGAQPAARLGGWGALKGQSSRIIIGVIIAAVINSAAYVFVVYAPTYVVTVLKLPAYVPFIGLLVSGASSLLFVPIMGAISDRIGKGRSMRVGLVAMLLLILPLYVWLNAAPSLARLLICSLSFSLITSNYSASFPVAIAELFPREIRATCMALSYNISSTVFGAFSLFFITLIMSRTSNPYVPAFYVLAIAATCLLVISFSPAMRSIPNLLRGTEPEVPP